MAGSACKQNSRSKIQQIQINIPSLVQARGRMILKGLASFLMLICCWDLDLATMPMAGRMNMFLTARLKSTQVLHCDALCV